MPSAFPPRSPAEPPDILRARRGRAFTLIELIVVILVLGILATIAVVGYTSVTSRAQSTRVLANLHQFAVGTLAQATLDTDGDQLLSRADVHAMLASSDQVYTDVYAGVGAAALELLASDKAPTGPDDLAIAFDNGEGTPLSEQSGTRATLSSATPDGDVLSVSISLGGEQCSGDWPAGTAPAQSRACAAGPVDGGDDGESLAAADTATTSSGWPAIIDVTANDSGTGVVSAVTKPVNGDAGVAVDGTVLYVSADDFVGEDSFSYTTSAGTTAVVTVAVTALTECTASPEIPAPWVPTYDGSAECAIASVGETPSLPTLPATFVDTGVFPVAGTPAATISPVPSESEVTALASFPHSNVNFPHVIYATTLDGGLMWVQDNGTCSSGATPCAWGWLSVPGTFTNPQAALTGQGPLHGTIPAQFTIDSMFVADANGIWVSRVNAFTRATAPEKVLDATAYTGAITSMTGYACFTGTAKTAGSCLWFVTDAGVLGQVNVDTGAVTLTNPSAGFSTPLTFVAAIVHDGAPALLLGTDNTDLMTVSPDGTVLAAASQNGAVNPQAFGVVDGQLIAGTAEFALRTVPLTTDGAYGLLAAPVALTGPALATAVYTHGVPGQFYWSGSPTACLYRSSTDDQSTTALWCADTQAVPRAVGINSPQVRVTMRGDVAEVTGSYARHGDGTVSYLSEDSSGQLLAARTVTGERDVTQIAAELGQAGLHLVGSGYALHEDGTVTRLQGMTSTPVTGLGTVSSFATRHGVLAYAVATDGQVYFIDGATAHAVAGATNVATVVAEDVPQWNTPGWTEGLYDLTSWGLDAGGWAVTKDGGVLRLENMVAAAVPDLTGVTSLASAMETPATAVAITEDGAVVAMESTLNYGQGGPAFLEFATATLGVTGAESFVAGEETAASPTVFVKTSTGGLWAVSTLDYGMVWDVTDTGLTVTEATTIDGVLYTVASDGELVGYDYDVYSWNTPAFELYESTQLSGVKSVVGPKDVYFLMEDGTAKWSMYSQQPVGSYGPGLQRDITSMVCGWNSHCVANVG